MSTETNPDIRGESTPYYTLTDENGDVVVSDTYDQHGEIENFVRENKTEQIFSNIVPGIEIANPHEIPLAVTVTDRAAAIAGIMAFVNKNNMTKGSETQLQIEDSDFNKRYEENALLVQEGAEEKRKRLFKGFVHGIHLLNATEVKQRLGYDPEDIRLEAIALKKEINDEFLGAGKSRARKQAVERARSLAEK